MSYRYKVMRFGCTKKYNFHTFKCPNDLPDYIIPNKDCDVPLFCGCKKQYKYTCPNEAPYVYPLPCCVKTDIPYTYKKRCCNNQRYVPVNNGIPPHMKYTYNRAKHFTYPGCPKYKPNTILCDLLNFDKYKYSINSKYYASKLGKCDTCN